MWKVVPGRRTDSRKRKFTGVSSGVHRSEGQRVVKGEAGETDKGPAGLGRLLPAVLDREVT